MDTPLNQRTLSPADVISLLRCCDQTRYPARNRMIVLLSVDAGLTVTEIAGLTRDDITHEGLPHRFIRVRGRAPRILPMSERLFHIMLTMLHNLPGRLETPLVLPERDQDGLRSMRPHSIANRLFVLFEKADLFEVSSRSGRATFIQNLLAHRPLVGASVEDVQALAGLRHYESLRPYAQAIVNNASKIAQPHPVRQTALIATMTPPPPLEYQFGNGPPRRRRPAPKDHSQPSGNCGS